MVASQAICPIGLGESDATPRDLPQIPQSLADAGKLSIPPRTPRSLREEDEKQLLEEYISKLKEKEEELGTRMRDLQETKYELDKVRGELQAAIAERDELARRVALLRLCSSPIRISRIDIARTASSEGIKELMSEIRDMSAASSRFSTPSEVDRSFDGLAASIPAPRAAPVEIGDIDSASASGDSVVVDREEPKAEAEAEAEAEAAAPAEAQADAEPESLPQEQEAKAEAEAAAAEAAVEAEKPAEEEEEAPAAAEAEPAAAEAEAEAEEVVVMTPSEVDAAEAAAAVEEAVAAAAEAAAAEPSTPRAASEEVADVPATPAAAAEAEAEEAEAASAESPAPATSSASKVAGGVKAFMSRLSFF
eukprot:tig00000293_g23883.t1